jgi:aminocarboxymuconate-semialdehyde decarboxylase
MAGSGLSWHSHVQTWKAAIVKTAQEGKMIIDAHTHGLNGKRLGPIVEAGGGWAKKILTGLRQMAEDRPQLLDIAFRVELLDKYGLDFQVVTPQVIEVNIFPGDASTRLEIARRINDNMASVREDSKGRLIPIGVIPLIGFNDDCCRELERAIKTLGLKGVNVPSHVMGKPLDSAEYRLFWAQAEELGIPVYIHPWAPIQVNDRSYEAEYDLTHTFGWPFETALALAHLVFSGIMESYPKLKVVSHHLGGGLVPFFMGRIMETYEPSKQQKVFGRTLPRSLFDYFSRFYYDTAVGGSAAAIRCAYEVFGAGQIVFATDAPMGPGRGQMRLKTYPDVVRSLNLPPAETEKILGGNILSIFENVAP